MVECFNIGRLLASSITDIFRLRYALPGCPNTSKLLASALHYTSSSNAQDIADDLLMEATVLTLNPLDKMENNLEAITQAFIACKGNVKRLPWAIATLRSLRVDVTKPYVTLLLYACCRESFISCDPVVMSQLDMFDVAIAAMTRAKIFKSSTISQYRLNYPEYAQLIVEHYDIAKNVQHSAISVLGMANAKRDWFWKAIFVVLLDYPAVIGNNMLLMQRCMSQVKPCMVPEPVLLGISKSVELFPDLAKICAYKLLPCFAEQHEYMNYNVVLTICKLRKLFSVAEWIEAQYKATTVQMRNSLYEMVPIVFFPHYSIHFSHECSFSDITIIIL